MIKEAIDLLSEAREALDPDQLDLIWKIDDFLRRADGQSSGPEQS